MSPKNYGAMLDHFSIPNTRTNFFRFFFEHKKSPAEAGLSNQYSACLLLNDLSCSLNVASLEHIRV